MQELQQYIHVKLKQHIVCLIFFCFCKLEYNIQEIT